MRTPCGSDSPGFASGPRNWIPRWRSGPTRIYARLDANSGGAAYTFTEVYLNGSGTWTVKPSGYTGTAREWNGNASVPVSPTRYVVLRWFGEVDEWRFQSGAC